MITELFKEAAVMKSFEHQNVLKLHGVTLDTVYRNEFWKFSRFFLFWCLTNSNRSKRHIVVIQFYLVQYLVKTWVFKIIVNGPLIYNRTWFIILKSPGLITTYMNKGDLRKFLRNSENQFSYKQVCPIHLYLVRFGNI